MRSIDETVALTPGGPTPQWGVDPVPQALKRLSGLDLAVLWGDLSIGLLVLLSGTLLVPALSLPKAVTAIVIGSLLGCVPLAVVGAAGAREGVPGMVLFRPVLGLRGSYVPSVANLVQLVGWTAFEMWAMGRVANAVSIDLFGIDAYLFWLAALAMLCTGLAMAGPIFAVRKWLEKFGVWVVAAVCAWITFRVLAVGDFGELWNKPGEGGLPFWLAVDIVIAMPISWLPLVADFNRFARTERASTRGTFFAYAAGNIWFFALGALLVVAAGAGSDVLDIGTTIAATAGGAVVLLALLAGETDGAMADIYSGAVSIQNIAPGWSQRRLIAAVGLIGFVIAAVLPTSGAWAFESFLLLMGSVFVPLFGVFVADWLILNRGWYGKEVIFDAEKPGFRWAALTPWIAGFVVYQWMAPIGPGWWTSGLEAMFGWLGLPFPLIAGSPIGASVPSFVVAASLSLLVLRASGEKAPHPVGDR